MDRDCALCGERLFLLHKKDKSIYGECCNPECDNYSKAIIIRDRHQSGFNQNRIQTTTSIFS